MIERVLEDIGLTKNEIQVYTTLLKIGASKTGRIIYKAGISSGKIYITLNKLIRKGLVSYTYINNIKVFSATDPKNLLMYMEKKKKDLEEEERDIKKILPKIRAIQKSKPREHVKVYKGYKGILNAANELLVNFKGKETYAMGITSFKSNTFNLMWINWHHRRIKKGVRTKLIFTDKGTDYYKTYTKFKLTKLKVLERESPSAVLIMGNTCMLVTYGKEPACTLIESQSVAKLLMGLFNTLWEVAK